jgi:hypothetical protein
MSNYEKHAMQEFKAAGWLNEDGSYIDEMQQAICEHVLKLLDAFAGEGHSGSSAPYTIDVFSKLASFKPIAPLTGEDWEWVDHEYCMQNKRAGNVFKQTDRFNGQAYDIDAVVFWEWMEFEGEVTKSYFTNAESCQPITFPYVPKIEYKFRPTEKFPNEVL